MNWTKVNIFTSSEGVESVTGCLMGIGINGFEIKDSMDFRDFLERKDGNWDYFDDSLNELSCCETTVTVYLADNAQGADMLRALRDVMDSLKERDAENKFGRLDVSLANVREEDWANNWKQYFKPLKVGEKILIKPSWENTDNPDNRKILEIDPESSFGTGQHNTTKLCLELLEKYLKAGDRQLDIGCGSGILSIAGYLLGAKECTAVDIDENSVKIAGSNAEKNHIPENEYSRFCGNIIGDTALREKILSGGRFDIITANIVADVLIAMSGIFAEFMEKGSVIIVSGIITERCGEVLEKIKSAGFAELEVRESDGWAAAVFKYI